MSAVSEHHARVVIQSDPPIVLPVISQEITMDVESIPYVSATIVCPLGDGAVLALDPQAADVWADIQVRRVMGRIDRIADLTLRYRGQTLAAITAQFAAKTVAAITRSLYHDYETPGVARREEARTFHLMLRGFAVDEKAATVTLSFASGEARLEDDAHVGTTPVEIAGANLAAKVRTVLARSGFTLIAAPTSTPAATAMGDEKMWTPGATAWEAVHAMVRKHDLILWCDETGAFRLASTRDSATVRTLTSSGPARTVTDARWTRSRDQGWTTAVMLTYTWNGTTTYDVATTPGAPIRLHTERIEKPYPGAGRAASKLRALRARGSALDLDAVSAYTINPGEQVRFTGPAAAHQGRLTTVSWRFPEDEMSLRMREVN
ncbi:MAG: hypothetical protein LBE05_04865 [Microbacterium sp.]|jgi:hypothetical protein|nr:hypothetical protein [Microbacterium sp.]